jgi:hypothetical protein
MAVAAAQRRRGVERMRELLERLARGAAHVHARDRRIAQRQHRGAQLVLAESANVVEVAELGQRVGEAGHGRLGQAGAVGDLLVAQHAFAGMEGAQDVEATGQGGDELTVLPLLPSARPFSSELWKAAVRVTRWLTLPMSVLL